MDTPKFCKGVWVYEKAAARIIPDFACHFVHAGIWQCTFFDLRFQWSLIFSLIGIAGVVITFLPDKKK